MDTQIQQLSWEKQSHEKFNTMIARIPLFHREIARIVVHKKAQLNARERGSLTV